MQLNMKKYFEVSLGAFVGIGISILLISLNSGNTAYGEEEDGGTNWWNTIVAAADDDFFDWNDVFNPLSPAERGKNLYNLVYKKQTQNSENRAVTELAKSYGLTTNEAQAAIEGSLTPILNNPRRKGTTLRIEVAQRIAADLQEDYATLQEIYQIQEEIDLATQPSEIFSNGDLSDSGFDLIHDLAMMEKVLFLKQKPLSVGGLFDEALDSPITPVKPNQFYEDYVANETDVAKLPLEVGKNEDGELEASIQLSDEEDVEIRAEILKNDVCVEENNEEDDDDGGNGEGDDNDPEDNREDNGNGDEEGDGDGDDPGAGVDESSADKDEVQAAPSDQWGSSWCPALEEPGAFKGASAAFPPTKFNSVSGSSTGSFASGGAGVNVGNEAFSANIGVCFETKLIKETVMSYQPGDSCIACEIEQINKYLEKTLSHGLVPNKVTGNILESAKCKKTGTLLNLQFITIFNPIPTPINDDLIFGKNILEEWNKFADNYNPLLLSEIEFDTNEEELQLKMAPPATTQLEVIDELRKIQDAAVAESGFNVKKGQVGNQSTNTTLYLKTVLEEVKQMNYLFSSFQEIFKKMNEDALEKIIRKSDES